MNENELKSSNVFCILPWVHQELQQNGDVLPCCISDGSPCGNLRDKTPKECWNSDFMKELRIDMLKGTENKSCQNCYNIEANGGISTRIIKNKLFESSFSKVDNTLSDGTYEEYNLSFLGIRFSNLCNMKCRYCTPSNSTSWIKELKEFNALSSEDKYTRTFEEIEPFLDDLLTKHTQLKEIYIAGGEALIDPDHTKLLKKLIEANRCDINLMYDTNLTTRYFKDTDIFELWKNFSNVRVSGSIDDIEHRFEYARKGGTWPQTKEHMVILNTFSSSIYFHINVTVNIYNVFYLAELFEYVLENKLVEISEISIYVLEDPHHFNITILPLRAKEAIKVKLATFIESYIFKKYSLKESLLFVKSLKSIISKMNSSPSNDKAMKVFKDETSILDKRRNESFAQVFPELDQLLKD
jgi:MoaA/NifB/PqqE/SkfB family radical SAM enzyme